jgi:lambda family phage portal protein
VAERWCPRTARWIAPAPAAAPTLAPAAPEPARSVRTLWRPPAARAYAAAGGGRLSLDWSGGTSSADAEISTSLSALRNRSRQLCRDNAYARRAREIVVSNVVHCGIGLQAGVASTRGRLMQRINDDIEMAWREWGEAGTCHTGGALAMPEFMRVAIAQVFEAGEVFIRMHRRPFGGGRVPLALELVESERLAESWTPVSQARGIVRLGIEVDEWQRPVAYYVRGRHPGDVRTSPEETERLERVPAADMIHLRLIHRWPQTRGEPWLHATARRLRDMDGYAEAEIVAARASASYMGFIRSPETPVPDVVDEQQRQIEFQPGMIEHLAPGEEFVGWNPSRPNNAMDPFFRLMLREVAAGLGVSYESLSRDYSQSNYSSSRLALLDDRDLWRMLQGWFIRQFLEPLYREWLQLAVLGGAVPSIRPDEFLVNPRKFREHRWKPRGWSWVDPTKEVDAYTQAVKSGFLTVSDVVAATAGGADIEDVLQARRRELDMMAELDLAFETSATPAQPTDAPTAQPGPEPEDERERVVRLRRS